MKLIDKLKIQTALPEGKSRLTYSVLAVLFGGIGVHNFYAGNSEKAKAQLTVGLVGLCCCCQPLYILTVITALMDVVAVTACSIMKHGSPVATAAKLSVEKKDEKASPAGKKPFPTKLVIIALIVLFVGLPILGGIVLAIVGIAGASSAEKWVNAKFDEAEAQYAVQSASSSSADRNAKSKPSKSDDAKHLTPDQKVDRLMAQLRKVLGKSATVSVVLATLQEKADMLQGDYKTKCILQEMFGLQNKIPGGVIPDLPDPNGNGALADYLKARKLDNVGQIMCFYHMLSDAEQASVSEMVRKLMK